jgi:4-diphosphocytidyl-2-C-methyl-D-erythritol kinase
LSGNSSEIPYNDSNLVYKACNEFFKYAEIKDKKVKIYIEKNIPISAGLAGGSTDAVATLKGLNEIFALSLTSLNTDSSTGIMSISERVSATNSIMPFCTVSPCCLILYIVVCLLSTIFYVYQKMSKGAEKEKVPFGKGDT